MSDGEHRRKGDLTPMSGELHTHSDWVPPGPVAERYRPKEEKMPPVTTKEIVLAGLTRIAVALLSMSALLVGVAFLLVHFGGAQASRAFPITFILGGALLTVGGFLGATTGPVADWMPEGGFSYRARENAFNRSFVYGAFGVVLVGIGVALDSYL